MRTNVSTGVRAMRSRMNEDMQIAIKHGWMWQTMFARFTERADGFTLGMVVGGGIVKQRWRYIAMALETPAGSPATVDGILSNHAHAVVGDRFRSMSAAVRASEKYARTWAKRGAQEPCACGTIGKKRRGR